MRRKASRPFCRNGSRGGRASSQQVGTHQSGASDLRIEALDHCRVRLLRLFRQGCGVTHYGRFCLVARPMGYRDAPDLGAFHDRLDHRNALLERALVLRISVGEFWTGIHDGTVEHGVRCGGTRYPHCFRGRVGSSRPGELMVDVFKRRASSWQVLASSQPADVAALLCPGR